MAFKLFGFAFGKEDISSGSANQFVSPNFNEPTYDVQSNGFISPTATTSMLNAVIKSENAAVEEYRDISREPEVDCAVEEIVSEMLVFDHDKPMVSLNMDEVELSNKLKDVINEEFKYLLGLLDFNQAGHSIVRRWYIDGRLNYIISIDEKQPQLGITQVQYVDPSKIKKIREIERTNSKGYLLVKSTKEYYLFNENGIDNNVVMASGQQNTPTGAIPLTTESVVHVNSGLYDPTRGFIVSELENAIKAVNSLRSVEESQIIYMMTRAPERRIFYIDVGNLSAAKSKQYIKDIADQYRTKILYDPVTGKVKSEKRFMAMTEDFWIPRTGGNRGTEIDTLPAGEAFSSTDMADYYKNKVWDALKVPSSRFGNPSPFSPRGTEITRDELRFYKRIQRLRMRFSGLFLQLLEKHLILKEIVDAEDWEYIKDNLVFDFAIDNYFAEAVDNEILQTRLSVLAQADAFVGKYYGKQWVYKHVLRVREEEVDELMEEAKESFDQNNQEQSEIQLAQAQTELQIQQQQMELQAQMQPQQPVQ